MMGSNMPPMAPLGARRYSAGAANRGYYNSTVGLPGLAGGLPNHMKPASGRTSKDQNGANMPSMYQGPHHEAVSQYMVTGKPPQAPPIQRPPQQ